MPKALLKEKDTYCWAGIFKTADRLHSFFIKRENNHRYGCTFSGMALMPENYKSQVNIMGIEISNMGIHELEDILYETSKYNDRDFKTFEEALMDMYGGINTQNLKKIIDFIENELGMDSDADLTHLDRNQKQKIVEFASKLE